MNHATSGARTIASGGNPQWTGTFTHPKYGELTFRGRLPLATDSLRHSIAVDNLLGDLKGSSSIQTRILASAIAGMARPVDEEGELLGAPSRGLMLDLPIIAVSTEPSHDGAAERTVNTYYDATAELDTEFLADVWVSFSMWRNSLLSDETVTAVGESSGATSTGSGESNAPSADPTAPPTPIPAS